MSSYLSQKSASASVRIICCWQQVSAHLKQILLRQVQHICEVQLKCKGHCLVICLTDPLSALPGVARHVVDSLGTLFVFCGDRQDLRGSFHMDYYNKTSVEDQSRLKIDFITFKMQIHQLQKYELVQSFVNSIKNAQSKQEFLNRVQEFDIRFTEDHSTHTYSEKQKSMDKLPPMPVEKPKNPFKTSVDENFRQHSFINSNANQPSNFSQPPQTRPPYSRTEQNFYKNPTPKNDNFGQVNSSFGYGAGNQGNFSNQQPNYNNQGNYPGNPQGNYAGNAQGNFTGNTPGNYGGNLQGNYGGNGGMGVLNYNAYSQKQYQDLKQQFFRPPPIRPDPYSKLQQNYGRQGDTFNMNQMGLALSSSTQLLDKPSARGYPERSNPFNRQ